MFLAGFAAGSPLVYSAATTVARKAFDAVAARSLRGISEVVSAHYKGDKEVLRLRDELELKVRIIGLPVDICVQHAVKGNSALQGVLDVALSVLRDIEDFNAALSQQDVAAGRGEGGTPARDSHTAIAKKLQALIKQLDAVLPYLGVAISSVSLLDAGQHGAAYSPSRLVAASHCLRTAPQGPGSAVLRVPAATWHQETDARGGSQPRLMQNKFPLCSITVVRQQGTLPGPEGAGQAVSHAGVGYELLVAQDSLNDGLYHEPDEQPGALRIPVQEVAHIGWSTSHAMKLGENDFKPALVLTVCAEQQAPASSASSSSSSRAPARRMSFSTDRKGAPAKAPQTAQPCQRYALQLRRPPDPDSDADETDGEAGSASKVTPMVRDQATGGGAASASSCRAGAREGELTSDWGALGELEYVLRLCMLEVREELPHHMVKDERIAMALAGAEAAAPAGRPASQPPSGWGSTPSGAEVDSLARNFDQIGFGSPLC